MALPPFIFTVQQLTRYLRTLLERDRALQAVWVRGEIGDLTCHSSGHLYFTLKDDSSRLRCAMFRNEAHGLSFRPAVGMTVLACGRVTIYEPMGQYQLIVEALTAEGAGALFLAFEALKKKLAAEGLFDPARKCPLPRYPNRIALLTSSDGAVLHDLLTVIRRRRPQTALLLIPTPVQGAAAVPGIVQSFRLLARCEGVDLAILARGGGSPEDLAAFNAEEVARAIAACPVPVVSAVGHEVDFTIADFVADLRAPTPSVAGELVVLDNAQVRSHLAHLDARRAAALARRLQAARRELALILSQRALRCPLEIVSLRAQRLDELTADLNAAFLAQLQTSRQRLENAQGRLTALSPASVLQRGYAVVRKCADGQVVRSARQLSPGEKARLDFADSYAIAEIEEVNDGGRD